MEQIANELLEELNCDTAFTIPVFGGIEVAESVVITWVIMAFMLILAICMTRNLKVQNPGKRQVILETAVCGLQNHGKGYHRRRGCRLCALSGNSYRIHWYIQYYWIIRHEAAYKGLECNWCAGNHEYYSDRIFRNPCKGRKTLGQELCGACSRCGTFKCIGDIYQTIISMYATFR